MGGAVSVADGGSEEEDAALVAQLTQAYARDPQRVERLFAAAKQQAALAAQKDAAPSPPLPSSAERALAAHNVLRLKHGARELAWSDECAAAAQRAAEECVRKNKMHHNNHEGQGQNLYVVQSTNPKPPPNVEQDAVDAWYAEIRDPGYNFESPGLQKGTGHFTQVVWRGSTHVGMGIAGDPQTGLYVAANYSPPGNLIGEKPFLMNVLREGEQPPAGQIDDTTMDGPITVKVKGGEGATEDADFKRIMTSIPFDDLEQKAVEALKSAGRTVTLTYAPGSITMEITDGAGGTATYSGEWG